MADADTNNLQRLFKALNREFFGGRLPHYRVRLRKQRFLGEKRSCEDDPRTIYPPMMDAEETRGTLLHEMCHSGTPGHGQRFQRKLSRLASMGEAWAAEEVEQYREAIRDQVPVTAAQV